MTTPAARRPGRRHESPVPTRTLGIVAALVVTLSGWWILDGRVARLDTPPLTGQVGIAIDLGRNPQPVVGSMVLCLDRPGSLRVVGVRAAGEQVRVRAFGLRPNPYATNGRMIGSASGSLAGLGIASGGADVLAECSGDPLAMTELVVEVAPQGVLDMHETSGFVIDYESASGRRELLWPITIRLCRAWGEQGCIGRPGA